MAPFDLVLALEIVEHVADTGLFYDAIARLVKPGGLLVMSTLNPHGEILCHGHRRRRIPIALGAARHP